METKVYSTPDECRKIESDLDALWREFDELSQSRDVENQLDNEQEFLARMISDAQDALNDCRQRLRLNV